MTYLEFLSLMVLYMAWAMLLVRMIMADEPSIREGDDLREHRRQ